MSPELISELRVAASWFADRAPIRALIITGAGRGFSAGGDVNWFKRGLDDPEHDLPSDVRHAADVLHQAIVDLRRIEYPVIAAVNGVAAAAGFSLALACDLRIAAEEASFACAYGRIGAAPDGGLTYFLPRVVGPGQGARADARRPDDLGRRGARARPRLGGRRRRRAPRPRPRAGARPRREGAALRADGQAADRGRASTTRSPTTSSSSATGSPTRWRPTTCGPGSPPSSSGEKAEFRGTLTGSESSRADLPRERTADDEARNDPAPCSRSPPAASRRAAATTRRPRPARRARTRPGSAAAGRRPSRSPPTPTAPSPTSRPRSSAQAGDVTIEFDNPASIAPRRRRRGRRRRRDRPDRGDQRRARRRPPARSSPASTRSTARSTRTARPAWRAR